MNGIITAMPRLARTGIHQAERRVDVQRLLKKSAPRATRTAELSASLKEIPRYFMAVRMSACTSCSNVTVVLMTPRFNIIAPLHLLS